MTDLRVFPALSNLAKLVLIAVIAFGSPRMAVSQAHDSIHTIDSNTEELPNGRVRLSIRNTSQIPITALVAEGVRQPVNSTHHSSSVRSFDSVLEPFMSKALESGQTYSIDFFGPKPDPSRFSERHVKVGAVLFADGHAWGDQSWIDILHSARRTAYKCESEALQVLVDAKAHPTTGAAIVQRLEDLIKENKDAGPSFDDRMISERVFKEVEDNVIMASQTQASLSHSLEPISATPASPPTDAAIQVITTRMRSIEGDAKYVPD